MFVSKECYKACIYARLSKDDGDKPESDSIGNQKALIRDFLKKYPEIQVVSEKVDDGYSGVNFERTGFKKMMEDIRAGRVDCVIVKDLSRSGRNYIEAGNYIERVFPFLGVRFISITENFDSFTCDDAESALMIPLKNMVNDVYAKDISRKIITSFRQRRETGDFIPGNPPYGYIKSKERQFRYDVDEKVAPYIRMLFEWKAAGVSHAEMARRLNDMGAVTPARRKIEMGIWHAEKYKHTVWGGRTLIDILTNPVYTGALVYGKIPKALYMGIRGHRVSKEEWRILDGMHEPIVSKELFDKVQEIFDQNRKVVHEKYEANAVNREGIVNRFKGKIVCGDCGKNMRYSRNQPKKRQEMYGTYTCGGYIDSHRTRCSLHYVYASDVEAAVYAVIEGQLKLVADME